MHCNITCIPQAAQRLDNADEGRMAMRYVYIGLIVALTALVVLFKVQNLETATVSLLSMSVTLPVSLLVIGVYVLGMFTGGFLVSLVRGWVAGAKGGG
jgi:lipopolysaccharide assembly protein A